MIRKLLCVLVFFYILTIMPDIGSRLPEGPIASDISHFQNWLKAEKTILFGA